MTTVKYVQFGGGEATPLKSIAWRIELFQRSLQ